MKIEINKTFKKDLKKHAMALAVTPAWIEVIYLLLSKQPLPIKYKDHPLKGNHVGWRDCHIKPDLVLLYRIDSDILKLARIGTHSDLF